MSRSGWRLTVAVASLVLLASIASPGVQAFSSQDEAIIPPEGHLVLMNLTVDKSPSDDGMDELGSLRYLIRLLSDSEQDRYDVLLMPREDYTNYLSGQPFELVTNASCIGVGEWPAYSYYLFFEEGEFTLLIDNSDKAGKPSAPAELMVSYEVVTTDVQVEVEPRWTAFIVLMVIISLLGVGFLLIVRISMRHRLKRTMEKLERRCPHCGEELPSFGSYCPYCGGRR